MLAQIFAYLDKLFNVVKPQNVCFMAIDGCAPRAKMNQQRARRFRAAKEMDEQREAEARQALADEDYEVGAVPLRALGPCSASRGTAADAPRVRLAAC